MPNIKITVAGKIATNITPDVVIVCGNSDYTVTFDLDAEWAAEVDRTARFTYIKDGRTRYKEKSFQGNTVAVPKLSGVRQVAVGLYAGDLHTTTAAAIWCKPSILCGDAAEEITPEEKAGLQRQIDAHGTRLDALERGGTGTPWPDWSHLKWYVTGDSLTDPAGGVHTSKFYYEYIAEKTGIQVIVDGLGGTGYHAGASANNRFADRVQNIPADVDIVTIFGSGNDVKNATFDEYKAGMAAAMGYFFNNRPGLPVIIVPPSPWATYGKRSEAWKTYCDTLELVALNYSLHYVGEMWTAPPFDPNSQAAKAAFFTKCADGIHPDENGHRLLAPYFYEAMRKALAFK